MIKSIHFIIPPGRQKVKIETVSLDSFVKSEQFSRLEFVLDRERGMYYNDSNDIF